MNDSCPVPTPVERQYLEIQSRAERKMLDTLWKALETAASEAAEELKATDWPERPPAYEYFAAVAHQKLFLRLAGADIDTMKGGDPKLAGFILDNGRKISEHYWQGRPASEISQTPDSLRLHYQNYIDCLNRKDLDRLGDFVAEDVHYNGKRIGLSGYRAMLENDHREIPDLNFNVRSVVADHATLASRIQFDVTPRGEFFGLPINGRRVSFVENVFYEFEAHRIARVWSVIDKDAVRAQLD
jgi:predicted ester cyclase